MPVAWEIRGSVLIVTIVRDWTDRELASSTNGCLADPRFHPGTALLLDARQSEVNSSVEEIESRAHWITALLSKGLSRQCAIVIGPKVFQSGLAAMARIYLASKGLSMRTFSDLDEAVGWLSAQVPPKDR